MSSSDVDLVVVGLPNHLHLEAVTAAVQAGKGILFTKPLARTAAEARRMLEAVEAAGVFHGYLEDLVYTPKMLKALESVRKGAIGRVLWPMPVRTIIPGVEHRIRLRGLLQGSHCSYE